MSSLLSVADAQSRILSVFQPGSRQTIPLTDAGGRVLFEQIEASIDLPPFNNSSVDGFAVRSVDVEHAADGHPVSLRVVADIPAGSSPTIALSQGQAARIMTGAPLPAGADAVVPVEETNFPYREFQPELPETVDILKAPSQDANVRPKGQDIHRGDVILPKGHRLRPQDLGILASLGFGSVTVYQQPRVALLSTGDELIRPDQPLSPGKIYDSNSYVLSALIHQNGGEILPLGFAPDDPDHVRGLLMEATRQGVDLIVTSAGVSVGAFDFIRQMIEQHGDLNFWRINMRPGKPLAFGSFEGVPLIGLPGNPVAAYVGCQVFIVPVLRKLAGLPEPQRKMVRATLQEPVESDGRESYLRGIVQWSPGGYQATLTGHQGSGNLFSLVQANALLIIPSGVKSLPIDAPVDAWLME